MHHVLSRRSPMAMNTSSTVPVCSRWARAAFVGALRRGLAIAVIVLAGCSPSIGTNAVPRVGGVFVPADAANAQEHDVGGVKQLSFVIDRPYPAFVFDDQLLQNARANGWAICSTEASGWQSFLDRTRDAPRTIHQRVTVIARGDELIVYSGRYISPAMPIGAMSAASAPSNTQQIVVAMTLRRGDPTTAQLLEAFGATCN